MIEFESNDANEAWIGAIMTAFPVFFAVVENDLRKVLSYSLNNQLGFMVVGIGVGTELAINGAAAHAFVHIIYKALLFMSMGAVLHRVGTVKASELGGLFKSMPATAVFCIIGAASISAFPLFSGFVAKALTLAAVAQDGHGSSGWCWSSPAPVCWNTRASRSRISPSSPTTRAIVSARRRSTC